MGVAEAVAAHCAPSEPLEPEHELVVAGEAPAAVVAPDEMALLVPPEDEPVNVVPPPDAVFALTAMALEVAPVVDSSA